jgi:hypothetical protein
MSRGNDSRQDWASGIIVDGDFAAVEPGSNCCLGKLRDTILIAADPSVTYWLSPLSSYQLVSGLWSMSSGRLILTTYTLLKATSARGKFSYAVQS